MNVAGQPINIENYEVGNLLDALLTHADTHSPRTIGAITDSYGCVLTIDNNDQQTRGFLPTAEIVNQPWNLENASYAFQQHFDLPDPAREPIGSSIVIPDSAQHEGAGPTGMYVPLGFGPFEAGNVSLPQDATNEGDQIVWRPPSDIMSILEQDEVLMGEQHGHQRAVNKFVVRQLLTY